jgi:hypothetical protein
MAVVVEVALDLVAVVVPVVLVVVEMVNINILTRILMVT